MQIIPYFSFYYFSLHLMKENLIFKFISEKINSHGQNVISINLFRCKEVKDVCEFFVLRHAIISPNNLQPLHISVKSPREIENMSYFIFDFVFQNEKCEQLRKLQSGGKISYKRQKRH